ncbi:MAG: SpoIIE family protein phosphatase [Lachnospiraceae bacterium]|nr:SpoIIE family protein phosphatase [Lachnospiraceae bacterium]
MLITVMLLTGAVSIISLCHMRMITEKNSLMLGETAAENAENALVKMAGQQLISTATEKASLIEEKFESVIACVNGIAQAAETIYQNPSAYPDRAVPLPVKDSRELAAQLLYSQRIEFNDKQLTELYKLGNLQELLVQYNANNNMISSTYLATASGWMLQADYIAYSKYSGASELPDFYEADERQWYQKALLAEEGECVYTDVMEDIHNGGDCIVCARAVYLDGEIVAVAGVGSYLNTVNEAVINTVIGENGYAFLVNEKGQIMVSGAKDGESAANAEDNFDLRESKNTELAEAAACMVKGESGLSLLTLDGKKVYIAYAPLEKLGWSFVTVMDIEEVIAPAEESRQEILEYTDTVAIQQDSAIRRSIYLFLIIVLITAVLIGAVSTMFAGGLTEPIRRLTAEVSGIGGGSLDRRICINTGDEVEALGNAFNDMAVQLQQYIANLKAATAEKEKIRAELSLGARIQADMLPDSGHAMRRHERFALCASMMPARSVGGDFYDFFMNDEEHLSFLIADVSGKGIPASLFMVVAITLFRSSLASSETLEEAVTRVNESLCAGNKNGMFVTAWAGVLTLSSGVLTYVNAGHNPPLLGNRKKGYEYLKNRGGFVLAGMEGMTYRQNELKLEPGDIIFLYTDGVTEANDENGCLYGEARLQALMNRCMETKPEKLMEIVRNDIQDFQGSAEQFDDITMLMLKFTGQESEKVVCTDRKKIDIAAKLTELNRVQAFVEETLAGWNATTENVRKFLIATDEIFSNICRHSGAGECSVECRLEGNSAAIIFEDDGIEFDPLKKNKPDIGKPLEQKREGGLGIYMVRQMMKEIAYERTDGKNCLTIKRFML